MPESSSRKTKKAEKVKVKTEKTPKKPRTQSRVWVAPLMLACWLLGLAWLVVFYVAGQDIPVMNDLGNWNLLIGMGLIAVGFVVSTQWV
ncbi:cell division protein CrgA [Kribbella solani]|uniref:cell division protein CrgA n=1 Tax=Kribbella solani TaxID=236067 RepID=UPI0029BF30EE|nr:cell division protein CrgA [Kribbella solani]MDX3001337.1 cell division protein CrgA [Kribbella solani]